MVFGGLYLQLWGGMVSQYIAIPLNTNVKYLASKWFYIRQLEPYAACDVDQIPVSNSKCSERPSFNGMEQVRELLRLINHKRPDGVIVATNFTFDGFSPAKRE